MSSPLKVFITYARENRTAKNKLITYLKGMQREGLINIWHDNEIIAGDRWREEIFSTNLPSSDLLLYLVSASSLYSENCNRELGIALEENIRPILIILEDCDWKNYKLSNVQAVSTEDCRLNEWESLNLGDIQALPAEGKPLNEWNPRSKGWQSVAEGLREAIDKMQSQANPLSDVSKEEILSDSVFQQGNILVVLTQVNKAIERYSYAIELNPNHTHAYNNRGIAYGNTGDFDRAVEDFNTAIELNSSYAIAYNSRGTVHGIKGDYDRAIVDFTKAIEQKRDYAEAYYNRGNIYNNKGNSDHAIADYTKAIGFNPNYTHAYNNRGNVYDKQGDSDRAIEDFNTAIKLNSSYANAYTNRGNAYDKKGDSDRAIADHTKAIELNPKLAHAYFNRGNVYDKKGDYDHAIVDYTKAIELNPKLAHAYGGRGVVYGKTGRYDLAIKDLSTAIEFRSDDIVGSIFYYNRGYAYRKKGKYACAIEDYTKAIELTPNYAAAYYNRGEAWLHLKEWEKARADLTTARDLGVDIVAAFHNDYKNVEAYERANRVKLPEDIAAMLTQRRRSRYPKTEKFLSADGTPLESPDVLNLQAKLRDAGPPLSQYVRVRPTFGIKTGGSGAFVVDSATRDQLIAEHPSSADILKPFLHGRDIRRWEVAKPVDKSRSIGDTWLIFAYRRIEIDRYPAIRKHLEKYRSALSKRADKQKWYELPTTRSNAELFTQTKLICPNSYDHQTLNSFYGILGLSKRKETRQ